MPGQNSMPFHASMAGIPFWPDAPGSTPWLAVHLAFASLQLGRGLRPMSGQNSMPFHASMTGIPFWPDALLIAYTQSTPDFHRVSGGMAFSQKDIT